MKIKMTSLSPVLPASGESSAHVDAEIKYCRYGFPYIQAKTFKGLLRESCLEVCEINGEDHNIVEKLFGKSGSETPGILAFNDLRILDYDNVERELKQNPTLRNNSVRKFFTVVRRQTSIDDTTGTAKDKSLRNYRLIKEGIDFETTIENIPYDNEELIRKALLNLRYIGTRRNRGFGKVKFEVLQETDANSATKTGIEYDNKKTERAKLSFEIEPLDTLILGKVTGDQNTVNTEQFIPAGKIRGLIAGLIIENERLGNPPAHKNNIFKNIILSGNVKYNNAFKENLLPVPKIYGYDKTQTESKAKFISEAETPLKGIPGFALINNEKLELGSVDTVFSFHSSRNKNRLAGRSTEEAGGIFYYEAIDKNQVFRCEILGMHSDLEYIQALFEQKGGIHRVGKSKSAQYSRAKFTNFKITETIKIANETKSTAYIVFQSPVITYNKYGTAVPDLEIIKNELNHYSEKIGEVQIFSAPDWVENYMGTWQSKTPRENAFAVGTTIKVEFTGSCDSEKLEFEGLGEHKNEGCGRVKVMTLESDLERTEIKAPPSNSQEFKDSGYVHKVLKKILTEQINAEKIADMEFDAIGKAAKYATKISNSLITRLKYNLQNCNSIQEWQSFMSGIEGKKAHKELDRYFLWEDIKNLVADGQDTSFEYRKDYYLCFFKFLRVKSKKQQTNG